MLVNYFYVMMMFCYLVVDRKAVSSVCGQKTKDTIMTGLSIGVKQVIDVVSVFSIATYLADFRDRYCRTAVHRPLMGLQD